MKHQPVSVAVAILYQDKKFLMQLRENIPGILYPGYWGFFGGHMEHGETPCATLKRELLEEINYELPATFSEFGIYSDNKVIRYVFHAPLLVQLDKLTLSEGWDIGLVPLEDVYRGNCYSAVARQMRPLGQIHQRILLDFIEKS